jgi:hypothetical protein
LERFLIRLSKSKYAQKFVFNSDILLRLSTGLGHDDSSRSVEWINERADIFTFIYQELRNE